MTKTEKDAILKLVYAYAHAHSEARRKEVLSYTDNAIELQRTIENYLDELIEREAVPFSPSAEEMRKEIMELADAYRDTKGDVLNTMMNAKNALHRKVLEVCKAADLAPGESPQRKASVKDINDLARQYGNRIETQKHGGSVYFQFSVSELHKFAHAVVDAAAPVPILPPLPATVPSMPDCLSFTAEQMYEYARLAVTTELTILRQREPYENDRIIGEVLTQVRTARDAWPPFYDAHHGHAVLREEFDELWDEVKIKQQNRDLTKMRKEAIDVAAMAIRFAGEVCNEEVGRK